MNKGISYKQLRFTGFGVTVLQNCRKRSYGQQCKLYFLHAGLNCSHKKIMYDCLEQDKYDFKVCDYLSQLIDCHQYYNAQYDFRSANTSFHTYRSPSSLLIDVHLYYAQGTQTGNQLVPYSSLMIKKLAKFHNCFFMQT